MGFAMIPHTIVSSPFFKKACWPSCRRCPLGSGCIRKAWDPKKWIMQPMGFAKIPHTIVSSPFFKRACWSSCRRCPLSSGCIRKAWDPKKWVMQHLSFASISHTGMSRPLLKISCWSSCLRCPLSPGASKDLWPEEVGCVVFGFSLLSQLPRRQRDAKQLQGAHNHPQCVLTFSHVSCLYRSRCSE